ncbi:MAG TPA: DUF4962 domain-containing protein [Pyrinomonadaceae bacterium]|nr:DUF4962 domain-containing protein [Pyrinomonadaceae bacterium]
MAKAVNVTRESHTRRLAIAFVFSCVVLLTVSDLFAQEIRPFDEVLARPVSLKKENTGVHPKLFFGGADIAALRVKAKGEGRELWAATLKDIQTLRRPVPDPKDEDLYKSGLDNRKSASITQYGLAFQISQTSLAYVIEQDERYLKAAKQWTLAACEMPIWGYTYNKPNVDLPPAHLLYAVAFAYDVLYNKLTVAEKETIRNKLLKQGRLMYDYFKYKPGKRYTYTQNHTWIPMAGLAIAAYAIMDEAPEAAEWARLSRAVFDRTMLAFGTDGYFYESFHYFGFAFRWMIRYFDAHLAATGENLYAVMKPKFDGMKYFAMHSVLPDGENVFDFADIGDGSLNRNGTSKRESIYSEYDILYRFASVYKDPQAQAIGDFLRTETKLETREPMWAFLSHDPSVKAASLSEIPLQYHFKDNDTVFWRSSWTKDATAFAFRCSPPEGHHAARLHAKIKDWRQNTGHAHPDANSFIIWANGRYLTGDTGYLGIKQTDDHNTILVNGRGQEKDGVYEMFKEVPSERLDKIRLAEGDAGSGYLYARGEAASGYYADLGIQKFDRHFIYVEPGYFVIWDELQTAKPSTFTFLLNADREIVGKDSKFELINGDARLLVERLDPVAASTEIVDQKVQARGLPGSVDKGDSEIRGRQLRVTTKTEAMDGGFLHVLIPTKAGVVSPVASVSGIDGGLLVTLANGRTDTICLGGACGGEKLARGRVVIHRGHSESLVFQRPTQTAKNF